MLEQRIQLGALEAKRERQRAAHGQSAGDAFRSSLVIVLMIVWCFAIGLIITLIGLIAFGGFAKGKWY